VTPAANDSVTATEDADNVVIFQAQGTTSKVGWVNIPVSAGGFNYVTGANDNEIVLATSPSKPNWVHAGRIPAADNFSPDTTIVFLGGRAGTTDNNVSWTMASTTGHGNYRVSREPNQGAVALAGAFCYVSESIVPIRGVSVNWGGAPGTAHKWLTNMAAQQAYLHSTANTIANTVIRTHLAKLSSFAVAGCDTPLQIDTQVAIGDTVTIDGATYYMLGGTHIIGGNDGLDYQCRHMLAKSSAF
jgi:hypothetical protein